MNLTGNKWSRLISAVVSFSLPLLMFLAGITPGQQLTESPSRMLTVQELRSLAGAVPCPQDTCSTHIYTDSIDNSTVCNKYVKYYYDDCWRFGESCERISSSIILKSVRYEKGDQYANPDFVPLCLRSYTDDKCTGGRLVSQTHGRPICED